MSEDVRHFKLLQELGRGAAGVIHLALDVETDQLVAVKHLSGAAVDRHRNAVARFMREVRILSRLEHPNLVKIVHCGRSKGRPFFAMEYVEGQTLNQVLAKKPLDLRPSLKIALQLAGALDYIHQHGIVHRDVKPSNILLDQKLVPRLADFGLAHDKGEIDMQLTASGTAVGTLRYCSPEQCAGDSHKVDGRADIYALGLILATCLTRKFPNCPESLQDLRGRFDREYRSLMNRMLVPEDVISLCHRAMRNEPDKRFKTAAKMAREIRACLRTLGPSQRLARAGGRGESEVDFDTDSQSEEAD
ncbi:MAG: serine/threonine protein kinase [Planctomycetota bacterium]